MDDSTVQFSLGTTESIFIVKEMDLEHSNWVNEIVAFYKYHALSFWQCGSQRNSKS